MSRRLPVIGSAQADARFIMLIEAEVRLCSSLRSLDFAHIPVVNAGHPAIVPGDCHCVPTRFSDLAAVSGIALPANAGALLEVSGFGGSTLQAPI
jgi:hypothetical protein